MKKKLHGMRKTDNSWQHCCRWCHHYSKGECLNSDIVLDEVGVDVTYISENGYVAEVLNESIEGVKREPFKELEYLLRGYNLSEKRIKEFNALFEKCFEDWKQDAVEQIDEDVTECFNNHLNKVEQEGIDISDPNEFCCSRWC